MPKTIVVTGPSSGFGAMTVRALADAERYAAEHAVRLHPIELDVSSQESVDAAVARILTEAGGLHVVVHNAGHMVLGPTEAFTPEQIAEIYDVNVLSTQRVNRAVPPRTCTPA